MSNAEMDDPLDSIAIIGMAGRFPKARNLREFWRNLCEGLEAISFFTDEELLADGASPELLRAPNVVKAGGMVDDVDLFDAAFFGFNPREAEITDPQQRIFLECAWEALEDAGYDPETYGGRIGVYSGIGANDYYAELSPEARALTDGLTLAIGNEKDFVATRVSYKSNLRGPSVTVQTACSTSLVTVSLACQSLLNYQSDMALAGGVSIDIRKKARLYTEGGILSPDGHCRAFDARAKGTIWGSGVGIVVLKRLSDALAEGDHVYAVIKGAALNNDGSAKIGYSAPSVEGQAAVVAEAIALAGVNPETISYIETHGTATQLGDPIEVAALTKVFRSYTDRKGFCRIGSVKTNIGHTDAAAGVAGLIKTALALKHRQIPASLNYESPNPQINFEESPFFVNTRLTGWESNGTPRRAGVSSFGIGGTNAHVILEEPPAGQESGPSRTWQLLLLSARSEAGLERATDDLLASLRETPDAKLADIAFTLQRGRRAFEWRRALVCRDREDAAQVLEGRDPRRLIDAECSGAAPSVAFMFPGQGTQYVNMGKGLYEEEPTFREIVDSFAEVLQPELGFDLREVLYPSADEAEEAARRLTQTSVTQPALFVIEYATARLWMEWGVTPAAMIGHSVGEYVAACLAGVFTPEEALRLVAARGRLIQEMPSGSMMALPLPEEKVLPLLEDDISLAAVNAPSLCVVSGTEEAITRLERQLEGAGAGGRRLHTSHAFHSRMMDPILERFQKIVAAVSLKAPSIPYVSNLTGTWITEAEATDPAYWVAHLRQGVRFSDGVSEIMRDGSRALLEVGPGRTLLTLVKQHRDEAGERVVAASLRHPHEEFADQEFLLGSLAQLWNAGAAIDWEGFYLREHRRRVSLPTFPFDRKRYWADGGGRGLEESSPLPSRGKKGDIADWFYVPSWKRLSPLRPAGEAGAGSDDKWLVFTDECGLGRGVAERLEAAGAEVCTVSAADRFARTAERAYVINPASEEDFRVLLRELQGAGRVPSRIVYLWTVSGGSAAASPADFGPSFYGPLFLAKAVGALGVKDRIQVEVVSDGLHEVTGGEELRPAKAALLGPCRVIPQEYPNVQCRSVDVVLPGEDAGRRRLAAQLVAEFDAPADDAVVAYRGAHRWVQSFEAARLEVPADASARLREGGVYLITGGTGGIGLELAAYLAEAARAKLVLVGRSALPERARWEAWLAAHGERDETSRRIRKLLTLEGAGAEVLVLQADVADRAQMAAAVGEARARFGAIHGVVHSAGVPAGGLIQLKTPEMAEPIFAPKVAGTLMLDELLGGEGLDFFLICSSVASVLGAAGQVDYCAANAFLDAFAHEKARRGSPYTVSVNWDAWAEVGMAVKAREIWPMTPDGLLDLKQLGRAAEHRRSDHPLFDRHLVDADQSTYLSEFTPSKQWVLSEHRVMGHPTLVGTAYLEMARAAFERHTNQAAMRISDVVFMRPLVVMEGERKEVQTVIKKDGEVYDFAVRSRPKKGGNGSAQWQEHAVGRITPLPAQAGHDALELDGLIKHCGRREVDMAEYKRSVAPAPEAEDGRLALDYGARWDNVKKIYVGDDEVLISLELADEYASDLDKFHLHPALLDKATSLAAYEMGAGGDFLPFSYGAVRLNAPLSRKVYSYARHKGNGDEVLKFDVLLLDEEGRKLVEIEDFTIRKLGDRALQSLADAPAPARPDGSAPAYAADEPDDLAEAILPAQGVEVFRRLLGADAPPQVVVSTRDIRYRMREAAAGAAAGGEAEAAEEARAKRPAHPRPNIKTPYVAPESELEQTIAGVWQLVLGIEQVGVHDNFIELGGHSLLAIQVISRLREALQMDLAMDSIFKAPTVSALADKIVQMLAEQVDEDTLSRMLAEIEGLASN